MSVKLSEAEAHACAEALRESNPELADRILRELYPETIINTTPHDIVIFDNDGRIICNIPAAPYEAQARASETRELDFITREGVPVYYKSPKSCNPLPAPKPNTYYIVSAQYARNCMDDRNNDILVVDQQVRDSSGRVIGCRSLAHC